MSVFSPFVLYNVVIVGAIWAGFLFALFLHSRIPYFRSIVSFSAGIFLGVAFLHMLPEAVELAGSRAGLYVLSGFIFFYLLERFIMVHPCEEGGCDFHHMGLAAFTGLSLHSILNGIALGSAVLVPGLGFSVFLATMIHKAPESFSLASLLVMGGRPRKEILPYFLLNSLMVPLGCFVAYAGLHNHNSNLIGAAIGFSAGTFIQIATGDLLPETHAAGTNRWASLLTFFSGIGVTLLTRALES